MATNRRKLFKLAEENGYKFKSCNGSHYKYEDENGQILIIPFNSIEVTKGMIHKVEKDIERNKCRTTNKRLKRNK